jgi:6-phosphofructo-2-kinase
MVRTLACNGFAQRHFFPLCRPGQALKSTCDIAIYDAANITANRRRWLAEHVAGNNDRGEGAHVNVNVIFVEAICYDEKIIQVGTSAYNTTSSQCQRL